MSEPAKDAAPAAAPPKGKGPLIIIMAVLAALIVGGAGGIFFMLKKIPPPGPAAKPAAKEGEAGEGHGEEAKEEAHEGGGEGEGHGGAEAAKGPGDTDGTVVAMQPFVVNLTDETGDPRYLKLGVAVELASKKWEKGFEHQSPRIRNAILLYMSNLKVGDILGPQNRKNLVDHLRTEVQTILGKRGVHDLYFTEFVIQ